MNDLAGLTRLRHQKIRRGTEQYRRGEGCTGESEASDPTISGCGSNNAISKPGGRLRVRERGRQQESGSGCQRPAVRTAGRVLGFQCYWTEVQVEDGIHHRLECHTPGRAVGWEGVIGSRCRGFHERFAGPWAAAGSG